MSNSTLWVRKNALLGQSDSVARANQVTEGRLGNWLKALGQFLYQGRWMSQNRVPGIQQLQPALLMAAPGWKTGQSGSGALFLAASRLWTPGSIASWPVTSAIQHYSEPSK
jgi:hypothetical protein